MVALDLKSEKYMKISDRLVEASAGEDEKAFQEAFAAFAFEIERAVLAEAEKQAEEAEADRDSTILAARGQRQLTSQEREFYQHWVEAARSANPKQALTDLDVVLPKTTINDIFTDLTTSHELLDAIDFQNVGAVTEWLMNDNPTQLATWSPLCAEIVKELTSGFKKVNLTLDKLSAFIPVCKAMLDLGPEWLDRYVRTVLQEALYLGLEDGIINGRGQTANLNEPIGMRKDLSGAVDPANGYPDKTPIAFTSFDPVAYGAILAQLAKTEAGKDRVVTRVVLVVNPTDYLTKVFPATTVRTTDGSYNNDVLPFPTTIVQSTRIEQGRAVIGIASRYFMGVGTGKSGRIEYSDEYHFLEDERVYLIKLYGHGQPKDNNSFLLLDISNLEPTVLQVEVVNAGDFPA